MAREQVEPPTGQDNGIGIIIMFREYPKIKPQDKKHKEFGPPQFFWVFELFYKKGNANKPAYPEDKNHIEVEMVFEKPVISTNGYDEMNTPGNGPEHDDGKAEKSANGF
jgi:hypothetical protein